MHNRGPPFLRLIKTESVLASETGKALKSPGEERPCTPRQAGSASGRKPPESREQPACRAFFREPGLPLSSGQSRAGPVHCLLPRRPFVSGCLLIRKKERRAVPSGHVPLWQEKDTGQRLPQENLSKACISTENLIS